MAFKSLAEKLKAAGLEASRANITMMDPAALTVVIDKTHPLYDDRVHLALDEELIGSFDQMGVINPVEIRENGSNENGVPILEVVSGRRRTLNLRECNKRRVAKNLPVLRIPVRVVYGSDAEMVLRAIAENAMRKDETPSSKATKIAIALRLGSTEEDVAKALGSAISTVQNLVRFLNLTPDVQAAIDTKELPLGAVDTFADVPRDQQAAVLTKLREAASNGGSKLKNHEVKAAVKAARKGERYQPTGQTRVWPRQRIEKFRAELETVLTPDEAHIATSVVDAILSGSCSHDDILRVAVTVTKGHRGRRASLPETKAVDLSEVDVDDDTDDEDVDDDTSTSYDSSDLPLVC